MRSSSLIISCEHASRAIPPEFRSLFREGRSALATHRGWDIGVLPVARKLAALGDSVLLEGNFSRLLVDLNRNEDSPVLFSEWTKTLSAPAREAILKRYHRPHWRHSETAVQKAIRRSGNAIHWGVHSFTPKMNGYLRPTQIGILYDPSRPREAAIATRWQRRLKKSCDYRIHRNLPYRGTGNGLISTFRKRLPASQYLGFEIEVNQALLKDPRSTARIADLLWTTFPFED